MSTFTLKVYDDKERGVYRSDERSMHGGIDLFQRAAFEHLFPDGECLWVFREMVHRLANLHGWGVVVTKLPKGENKE